MAGGHAARRGLAACSSRQVDPHSTLLAHAPGLHPRRPRHGDVDDADDGRGDGRGHRSTRPASARRVLNSVRARSAARSGSRSWARSSRTAPLPPPPTAQALRRPSCTASPSACASARDRFGGAIAAATLVRALPARRGEPAARGGRVSSRLSRAGAPPGGRRDGLPRLRQEQLPRRRRRRRSRARPASPSPSSTGTSPPSASSTSPASTPCGSGCAHSGRRRSSRARPDELAARDRQGLPRGARSRADRARRPLDPGADRGRRRPRDPPRAPCASCGRCTTSSPT